MGRILAIDYGLKRTGLAISDPLKIIASSLDVIHPDILIEYIVNYLKSECIECIVVGFPKKLNNQNTDLTQHVVGLIRKLKKTFPDIAIEKADERFTSKIAMQAMIDGGVKKSQRRDKKMIDKISATLILQNYLNYLK
ncbi:MAG: Holliday junction resolvase RuvX [Bacteroidota bacterium]